MRKLMIPLALMFILAGCPNKKEIKEMADELQASRNAAIQAVQSKDFSTDNLLVAHDYFFKLAEKVHLMKEDEKSLETVKSLIESKGMAHFCERFIFSRTLWKTLNDYCQVGTVYRCSPDIQFYPETQKKFLELVGSELAQKFQTEPNCQ